MLGEYHSVISGFPECEKLINALNQHDAQFSRLSQRYDSLDSEIRRLELDNAPIDDSAMHNLKLERAALKDKLYHILLEAQ